MVMREYFFRVKGLRAGYGGKAVVEDLEVLLGRGEILSLIGPNGAGKSTVLRSIAGQLGLMGGAVFLDGEVVAKDGDDDLPGCGGNGTVSVYGQVWGAVCGGCEGCG